MKLTHNIRESVYPGIIEIDKTIITISSAAIVLTIQLIDKPLIEKQYLMWSWVGFSATIGMGAIILLANFTYRLIDKVKIKEIGRLEQGDHKACDEDDCFKLIKRHRYLETVLLLLVYIQVITLLLSLISLLLFGYENVKSHFV